MRSVLAAALAVSLLATTASADDGDLARRIATLKFLVNPSAEPPAGPSSADAPGCPPSHWWAGTGHGVHSRIQAAIRDAARRYGTDPRLIQSVIRHESSYAIDAVSHKGAMGLMQLMPRTARELGVTCPFDPRENVLGGTRYLRRLYDRLGSWPRAIAAYHAGARRVERNRIPDETRRYVERVLESWKPRRSER